jgi:metal-responsive CopG/Arc/MetJ family transcriptional regulator
MPESKVPWKSVSLPEDLIEEIRKCMPSSYSSIAEFIKDACRRRIEEICEAHGLKLNSELEHSEEVPP